MISIKGSLNIYYSTKNPDPRANNVNESSCQGCDGCADNQIPPKVLKIQQYAHIHGKHQADVSKYPFNCDFIYISVDCLDSPILDKVMLDIQASTQMTIVKKKKKDLDESDEEGDNDRQLANTSKLGLHKFMK